MRHTNPNRLRRTLLVVAVASLLVLSGCLVGVDTDTDWAANEDGDEDEDEEATPVTETDADEHGAESDDDSATTESPSDGTGDDETEGENEDRGDLEIHHLDVGQADATLLVEPSGETMLIDSGDWRNDGADVIAALEERGIDRIDHLVATHAHADHIGGHEAVIDHVEEDGDGVGAAYDSGVAHTSQTYDRYLDAIDRHDVTLFEVREGDSLEFGAADVQFYNPPERDDDAAGASGDLHYNSIVLTVEYGDVTYLTTGDAETDAEQRLVEAYGDELDADVYQAGHHGSSTSSTDPFLDRVTPEIVVISSDRDSQYGHPHDEVLETFADRDLETYWTGVHGDIVLTTDGTELTVETEHEASSAPLDLLEEKPSDESSTLGHPIVDLRPAPMVGP
ncbi:MBL fold metallo-hydrolase [Halobacteria archaeon AArc-m2/3/4]|uniref:MBL fold metallo-hydrolase n=1 Tax=Natronoglomus mannanivorans TaxID=2979990 RepID=A0ABT2Q8T1_9EURY|nr:MBL fold metallo-hydrolase [Halobacteria archaeon AArc-m2/3/4]